MPNEFIARNGLIALAPSSVSGSLFVSGGFTIITGSGVEFQVNADGTKIGNVITDRHTVTGSINVSGSVTAPSFTGSLQGSASFATTASFALAVAGGGGGGGGLTVNISQINNSTINPPSGNGDTYIYTSTGVNTFILPTPVGNKNQYTIKLVNGSATIYVSDFSLIDDGTIVVIDNPYNSIDISPNDTNYIIY
jgi:hypothetical protein